MRNEYSNQRLQYVCLPFVFTRTMLWFGWFNGESELGWRKFYHDLLHHLNEFWWSCILSFLASQTFAINPEGSVSRRLCGFVFSITVGSINDEDKGKSATKGCDRKLANFESIHWQTFENEHWRIASRKRIDVGVILWRNLFRIMQRRSEKVQRRSEKVFKEIT